MAAGIAQVEDSPGEQFGPATAVVAGSVVALRLYVPIAPRGQGRPRSRVVTPTGKRPFVQVYPDNQTRDYEEEIVDVLLRQIARIPVQGEGQDFILPFKERIIVTLRFNLKKPVSYPASFVYPTKKPDSDNLAKSILDALVKGRILEDDALVTDLSICKRYASPGHPEGVEIDVTAFG